MRANFTCHVITLALVLARSGVEIGAIPVSVDVVQGEPTTMTTAPSTCDLETQFECATGEQCIDKSWFCDFSPDCTDGSDEAPLTDCAPFMKNCTPGPTEFRCANTKCTPTTNLCDGLNDCGDGSDESLEICDNCAHPDLFRCAKTGKCLHKMYICDGDPTSCGEDDSSDEDGCLDSDPSGGGASGCPKHSFACKVTVDIDGTPSSASKLRCKNEIHRCNGVRDCDGATDELNCPPRHGNGSRHCEPGVLECSNHLCVEMRQICDGVDDCLDGGVGSDEVVENCGQLRAKLMAELDEQFLAHYGYLPPVDSKHDQILDALRLVISTE